MEPVNTDGRVGKTTVERDFSEDYPISDITSQKAIDQTGSKDQALKKASVFKKYRGCM